MLETIPYMASAIAAGNACIVKIPEFSAHSSKVLADLITNYLDQDCYAGVEGQTEVAKKITSLPFDKIIFTGSPEKGKLVAMAAAKNLVPCCLELGGKSPTVVGPEASLDNACLRIAQGKFVNSGQTCIANDYIFVHESLKDKFIEKFKATVEKFYGQDAFKCADYSRMIN
mmetsp:Transcript_4059/g.3456  ORF Transcript_4059/g.3456 Transcript_4059/m.3456 type:complete len:171 (-) Transcript_4059:178-690(-)